MDAKTLIILFLFFGAVALLKWLVAGAIWTAAAPDEQRQARQLPVKHPEHGPVYSRQARLLFTWTGRIFAAGTLIYSLLGLWHVIKGIGGE